MLILNRLTVLGILLIYTSCNGQIKPEIRNEHFPGMPTFGKGQLKLKRTQRSNENQNIGCGIQDRNGNIWFGSIGEGVYKFDGKLFTQYTQKDGLSSNHVWSILEDRTGNIWFGTTEGICRYDGNRVTGVPITFYVRPVISNNSYYTEWSTKNTVWCIWQDKRGKMWFGTGDGVYCYDGFNFTRLLANDNVVNKDSLQLRLVASIVEYKENIWFGSSMPPGYEGFCRYDGKTIESYRPKNQGWIRNVVESRNGNLLLATRSAGILSYDGKTFTDYMQPKELIKGSLSRILEDKSGNLWVASMYGNDIGDTLGGLWRSNPPEDKNPFTKITSKDVYFMLEDKDGNVWFATGGMGLYRYDGKSTVCFSE
jgi:ligand-binding sensor domain-containing protein